jgi:hypothetical protein
MEFSRLIRVAALAMPFALVATPDTLVLKNGAQYSGVFVSGDRDRITFSTDNKGNRTFYARDIDRIVFGSEDASAAPLPRTTDRGDQRTQARDDQWYTADRSDQNAANQRVNDPGQSPPPVNDIQSEYQHLGAESSTLGPAVSQEQALPDNRGRVEIFRAGAIYWTPENGAHAVSGPIRDAWTRDGAQQSDMGYPISDEQAASNGRDRVQYFEHGAIYWNPDQGARYQLNQQ